MDEQPRGARLLKDLGLAGLRHGQAAGAERELPEPDLGRLVRLRVRPQGDRVGVRVRLEPPQVRLEAVEVDNRRRRFDFVERSPDLRLEQLERPLRSRPDVG